MPVNFRNFDFSYERDGKRIFAQSDLGTRIGKDIARKVGAKYRFDPFVFHIRKSGGHVAALHTHRNHHFFARVDIRRFFYGIGRNRVRRALSGIAIERANHYAKWSCVKNPYDGPTYVLPYGFVQSPILATLVLLESQLGALLRELDADPRISVTLYMDDITISSDEIDVLNCAFKRMVETLEPAGFDANLDKLREPQPKMDLFNCSLVNAQTEVLPDRVDRFHAELRSAQSLEAFDRYCSSVAEGNA
jgi:hypothetical protein